MMWLLIADVMLSIDCFLLNRFSNPLFLVLWWLAWGESLCWKKRLSSIGTPSYAFWIYEHTMKFFYSRTWIFFSPKTPIEKIHTSYIPCVHLFLLLFIFNMQWKMKTSEWPRPVFTFSLSFVFSRNLFNSNLVRFLEVILYYHFTPEYAYITRWYYSYKYVLVTIRMDYSFYHMNHI